MNNTYQSIDDLLKWFSEGPRTKRWDALLAFDQATTNTLLLQQYIERFNSESYLPPINETIELGSGSVVEIRGYVFDKPRLSFENANLDAPTATLRMQGMGGVRLHWNVAGSTRKLESIAYEYPVNGDIHESVVTLKDNSVSIKDHRVIIDVADGTSPVLKFGGALSEKKRAGEKIKSVLGINPPEVREYVLSELKGGEDPLFAPGHIMLLTQPAPANRQRGTAQYGDGAVLAFVALGDGTPGDRPTAGDPDWRYLLDPSEDGHSAMIVLSNEWLITRLIADMVRSPIEGDAGIDLSGANVELVSDGPWKGLQADSGKVNCKWYLGPEDGLSMTVSVSGNLDMIVYMDKLPLKLRKVDDGLELFWLGHGEVEVVVGAIGAVEVLGVYEEVLTENLVKLATDFDQASGKVSVVPNVVGHLEGTPFHDLAEQLGFSVRELEKSLPMVQGAIARDRLLSVNTAHMASILLSGEQPIQLKGAGLPGDLVMYGDISNERTGVVLNQQEILIGASTSFQFTATGAGEGTVIWALELVDGTPAKPDDAGTITAAGHYTAPAVISSYARVRLTATRGEFVTQALITVVRDLAAVSPAIQLAVAGAGTRHFVRGGATEAWAWDTSGLKGTLQEPVPEPGDEFEPGDMQYVPPATIEGDFIVEEIKLKVGSNVTTAKIVVIKGSNLDISAELGNDLKTATLSASSGGTSIPTATFVKVAGSGTLDGKKVTSEDAPAEPFIVVQAVVEGVIPGLSFFGYLLLPLPLSVLEGTRSQAILQDPSLTF